MHRNDAEDMRRRQLVAATLDTIAEVGFGATTLTLIGQRAGVSAGLIAHYFGDKDGLLEAALRGLAARLSRATTDRLRSAHSPRERVEAVIAAALAPEEFEPRSCGVWLAFWGEANHAPRLRRIQTAYQRRMLSNLRHALRQMVPATEAGRLATALAALIDGLWLRAALSSPRETDSATARAIAAAFIGDAIRRAAVAPGEAVRTQVDLALAAAATGRGAWARQPPRSRGDVLRRAAAAMRDRHEAAAETIATFADVAGVLGDVGAVGIVAIDGAGGDLAAVSRAVAPALAFGNAVLAITDDAAPLGTALVEAGLPEGVFTALPARCRETLRHRPEISLWAAPYRTMAV